MAQLHEIDQARIQVKWGVNFCNNVIEPKPGWGVWVEVNIWGIRKKRKEGGSEKGGVKIHPFHLPWIRACRFNYVLLSLFGTSKSTEPIFTSWSRLHVKTPAHLRSLTFFNKDYIHTFMRFTVHVHGSVALNKLNYVLLNVFRTFLFYKNIVFPVEVAYPCFSAHFRLRYSCEYYQIIVDDICIFECLWCLDDVKVI